MAVKRVIILDNRGTTYRVALWAVVPVERRPYYAEAGKVSAWPGAVAAENAALADGMLTERVITYDAGSVETLNQVKAVLEATWASFQAEITTQNRWERLGSFWDGATWTAGGVA